MGKFQVIVTDNRQIAGNGAAFFGSSPQRAQGHQVIQGKDGGGAGIHLQDGMRDFHTGLCVIVAAQDQGFISGKSCFLERPAIAYDPLRAVSDTGWTGDAGDAGVAELEQMPGGKKPSKPVVGQHHVNLDVGQITVDHHYGHIAVTQIIQ